MSITQRREERDRFVAFAFAAADLLLELDGDRIMRHVLGASTGVTGRAPEHLVGKAIEDLIAPQDQSLVRRLLSNLSPDGGRMEIINVQLNHAADNETTALLGCCRMPTMTGIFATLTLTGPLIKAQMSAKRDKTTGLLDNKSLMETAQALALDKTGVQPRQLTLMRVEGIDSLHEHLPESQVKRVIEEVSAVLRARSMGGNAAGRIAVDVFGLVEAGLPKRTSLAEELNEAARSAGVDAGLLTPIMSVVDLASGDLAPGDVERALAHSVKRFLEPNAPRVSASNLKAELAAGIAATVTRVAELRSRIAHNEIVLAYQPIVSLDNRQTHHYEALARTPDWKSAFETIAFSEEVGLIAEVDLMIFRRALDHIGQGSGLPIAVNVSGQSVQQPGFRDELIALLERTSFRKERLVFELTESAAIVEVTDVANFLRWLRQRGHRVCLDDFGAGAAAYSYLRNFEVDFVKIDGMFLQATMKKERERALIASIVKLCQELNCKTIGEMIETEQHAKMASSLGIGYGQGWLFGKPMMMLPEEPIVPVRVARRQGAKESWG